MRYAHTAYSGPLSEKSKGVHSLRKWQKCYLYQSAVSITAFSAKEETMNMLACLNIYFINKKTLGPIYLVSQRMSRYLIIYPHPTRCILDACRWVIASNVMPACQPQLVSWLWTLHCVDGRICSNLKCSSLSVKSPELIISSCMFCALDIT